MAVIEHILTIYSDKMTEHGALSVNNAEFKFNPYEFDKPCITVDFETVGGRKVVMGIDTTDAIALRDFLDTIIPAMEKQPS